MKLLLIVRWIVFSILFLVFLAIVVSWFRSSLDVYRFLRRIDDNKPNRSLKYSQYSSVFFLVASLLTVICYILIGFGLSPCLRRWSTKLVTSLDFQTTIRKEITSIPQQIPTPKTCLGGILTFFVLVLIALVIPYAVIFRYYLTVDFDSYVLGNVWFQGLPPIHIQGAVGFTLSKDLEVTPTSMPEVCVPMNNTNLFNHPHTINNCSEVSSAEIFKGTAGSRVIMFNITIDSENAVNAIQGGPLDGTLLVLAFPYNISGTDQYGNKVVAEVESSFVSFASMIARHPHSYTPPFDTFVNHDSSKLTWFELSVFERYTVEYYLKNIKDYGVSFVEMSPVAICKSNQIMQASYDLKVVKGDFSFVRSLNLNSSFYYIFLSLPTAQPPIQCYEDRTNVETLLVTILSLIGSIYGFRTMTRAFFVQKVHDYTNNRRNRKDKEEQRPLLNTNEIEDERSTDETIEPQ